MVAVCQGEVVADGEVGRVSAGPDQVYLGGYVAGAVPGGEEGASLDRMRAAGQPL